MISQSKWEWFGTWGHFICGQWCRFHMTTAVGDYLISTVGEYIHPSDSGGSEVTENAWIEKNWPGSDVGAGRKYETMVFKIKSRCRVKECGKCGLPKINGHELDFTGYATRGDATRGHMAMCLRWAKRQ